MLVDGLITIPSSRFMHSMTATTKTLPIKRALKSDKDVLTALNTKIIIIPVPLCIVYFSKNYFHLPER